MTSLLLALLVLATPGYAIPSIAQSDSSSIVVSLDSIEVVANTPFVVPITVISNSGSRFSSYEFVLRYDATLIEPDSIDVAQTLSADGLVFHNTPEPGLLHVAAASDVDFSDDGLLLNILFHSKEEAGPSSLEFASFQFQEESLSPITRPGLVEVLPDSSKFTIIKLDSLITHIGEAAAPGLHVQNAPSPFYSGVFSLAYNEEVVEPVGVQFANAILGATGGFADYVIPEEGTLTISFASPHPITDTTKALFHIEFEGIDQPGSTPLTLKTAVLDENKDLFRFEHGMLRFVYPFTWGDTTLDDQISISDAMLILWHILQKAALEGEALNAADVSGNKVITSFDAALVLMYAHSVIQCFPADQTCQAEAPGQSSKRVSEATIEETFRIVSNDSHGGLALILSQDVPEIHALDVSILTYTDAELTPVTLVPHVPEHWIYEKTIDHMNTLVSMAGPSELPPGTILHLGEESISSIHTIQLSINGEFTYSLSPRSYFPPQEHITEVSLYPNPVSRKAVFSYTQSDRGKAEILIYDVLGRRVQKFAQHDPRTGKHQIIINGEQLAPGFYSVHLLHESGSRHVRRFVKR